MFGISRDKVYFKSFIGCVSIVYLSIAKIWLALLFLHYLNKDQGQVKVPEQLFFFIVCTYAIIKGLSSLLILTLMLYFIEKEV